jgi:hypothetical protein
MGLPQRKYGRSREGFAGFHRGGDRLRILGISSRLRAQRPVSHVADVSGSADSAEPKLKSPEQCPGRS